MPETLEQVKNRIARTYLGHPGIHGIGLHAPQNAVCIYLDQESAQESNAEVRQALLAEIARDAAPYEVIAIPTERAHLNEPTSTSGND